MRSARPGATAQAGSPRPGPSGGRDHADRTRPAHAVSRSSTRRHRPCGGWASNPWPWRVTASARSPPHVWPVPWSCPPPPPSSRYAGARCRGARRAPCSLCAASDRPAEALLAQAAPHIGGELEIAAVNTPDSCVVGGRQPWSRRFAPGSPTASRRAACTPVTPSTPPWSPPRWTRSAGRPGTCGQAPPGSRTSPMSRDNCIAAGSRYRSAVTGRADARQGAVRPRPGRAGRTLPGRSLLRSARAVPCRLPPRRPD